MIRGVSCHFRAGVNDATNLAALEAAGITSIRDEITWAAAEQSLGVLALPATHQTLLDLRTDDYWQNQQNLFILCYNNTLYGTGFPNTQAEIDAYCDYCEYMVTQFSGTVKYWEIWNEWNIGIGVSPQSNGTAAEYITLAQAAIPRIRAADPTAKILVGANAGFGTTWPIDVINGGILALADGWSFHPYVYNDSDPRPENCIAKIETFYNALKAAHGQDFDLFLTEFGWPTDSAEPGYTHPETAARNLARFFLLAEQVPYIKGAWWYTLLDLAPVGGTYKEFGLRDTGNAAKASHDYLSALPADTSNFHWGNKKYEKKKIIKATSSANIAITPVNGAANNQSLAAGQWYPFTAGTAPKQITGDVENITVDEVPGNYEYLYLLCSQSTTTLLPPYFSTTTYNSNTYYCYHSPIDDSTLATILSNHPTAVYRKFSRDGTEQTHEKTLPGDFPIVTPSTTFDGYEKWW